MSRPLIAAMLYDVYRARSPRSMVIRLVPSSETRSVRCTRYEFAGKDLTIREIYDLLSPRCSFKIFEKRCGRVENWDIEHEVLVSKLCEKARPRRF